MSEIRFQVFGAPKGQPRPRAFAMRFEDRYQARVYDSKTAEGWKSSVAQAARAHLPQTPLDGPLTVILQFRMPRPKSHYGSGSKASALKPSAPFWFKGKPDADNLAKAVLDALTQLGMWQDDSQVCQLTIRKYYVGESPGCDVVISQLMEPSEL